MRRRTTVRAATASLVGAALIALTACEPTAHELSANSVSLTTDQTATNTLERIGFDVRWFNCTATVERTDGAKNGYGAKDDAGGAKNGDVDARGDGTTDPAPGGATEPATVACEGKTRKGQPITLKGKVTDEIAGACVRGDLDARVDGQLVFEARYLGNCAGGPSGTTTTRDASPRRPAADGRARPTVTVTVTETVTAPPQK
ncbi:hypothetical protein ACH41E_22515 [Streptomyces sp. NPDC020412]|uniref:hypothetical protein n=1 Tax=Streptomyces sp. NPDC020412 TaxID=3365073 RepID=UPI0037B2C476